MALMLAKANTTSTKTASLAPSNRVSVATLKPLAVGPAAPTPTATAKAEETSVVVTPASSAGPAEMEVTAAEMPMVTAQNTADAASAKAAGGMPKWALPVAGVVGLLWFLKKK